MTPIDIQVSRLKVKVKGHARLLYFLQLISEERFAQELITQERLRRLAQEASNLVGR